MAAIALCLAAAGCGNTRTPTPDSGQLSSAGGLRALQYPSLGLSIAVPRGWIIAGRGHPLVLVAVSGNAVIALWRYVRTAPAPGGAALAHARQALVAAVRRRQPGIDVLSARTLRVNQHPAIVLETISRIAGVTQRVRSIHLFAPGEEVVLEEYAPPAIFPSLSRRIFVPVRKSLVLGPAQAGR